MTTIGTPAPHDIFTDNHRWGDLDDWNRTALALHQQGGIHRMEREGYPPFWAVIDHAAVMGIERQHELFTNSPHHVLVPTEDLEASRSGIITLVRADEPEHGKLRRLTNDWFKPASVRRLDDRLDELSDEALQKLRDFGGECDFASEIAWSFPLQVILEILGLPESDYPLMLKLTQELFGQQDPDLQREGLRRRPRDPGPGRRGNHGLLHRSSWRQRRADPTDDLATVIANGLIDGEPMGDPEIARVLHHRRHRRPRHDIVRDGRAGSMPWSTHPDQLREASGATLSLLNNADRGDRSAGAAPVRHFMRTAQDDTEILRAEDQQGRLDLSVIQGRQPRPEGLRRARSPSTSSGPTPTATSASGTASTSASVLSSPATNSADLFGRIVPEIETIELAGEADDDEDHFRRRAQDPPHPLHPQGRVLRAIPAPLQEGTPPCPNP